METQQNTPTSAAANGGGGSNNNMGQTPNGLPSGEVPGFDPAMNNEGSPGPPVKVKRPKGRPRKDKTMPNGEAPMSKADKAATAAAAKAAKAAAQIAPPNGKASPPTSVPSSGAPPPPPNPQHPQHPAYAPYPHQHYPGYPGPQRPMMAPHSGYPGHQGYPSQSGGPTPTLNSLLQGGNHPQPHQQQNPYDGSGGYPPPWASGGGGGSGDPNSYPHYPHNAPRHPYGPPSHQGYPPPGQQYPQTSQYGGYPPPPPGPGGYGQQQQQPPYQHPHQQPPTSESSSYQQQQAQQQRVPTPTTSSTSSASTPPPPSSLANPPSSTAASAAPTGALPPHPGRHEGRPSQTWTPPVQQQQRKDTNAPQGQQQHNSSPNTQQESSSLNPGTESYNDEGSGNHPQPPPHQQLNRPTPSPTGSSSSRSMSPTVGTNNSSSVNHLSTTTTTTSAPISSSQGPPPGAMPPRPPSGPGGNPQQQQGYHQSSQMGPPPNMMYNKMGQPVPPPGAPGSIPPQNQPMPSYGPGAGQPNINYPGQQQPYGMPPRMGSPGFGPPYGPRMPGGQYPGYYSSSSNAWGGGPPPHPPPQQGMMGAPQHKSMTPSGPRPHSAPVPAQYSARSPHPQMKGYPPGQMHSGYNGPPSSNSPSYNGPPGPGMPPPVSGTPTYYPNASSSYNEAPTSSAASTMNNNSSGTGKPASGGETVGPDGVPMHDESSQQSTLSQSSDRSDGGRQTPKGPSVNYGPMPGNAGAYPRSPHGGAGAPSPGSFDAYARDMGSPGWQQQHMGRPPASPMMQMQYNHSPQGTSKTESGTSQKTPKGTSKADSLARLYEMDDHPERRMFLDKLLHFMEERGSPITQCPTISKNPLDLFRLYIFTKERGGFMECTKNKTWKDIAAQLGIGASSSGAYTLKKHYGKNLLPFECHFDRGGIDPGPLLAQVEAQSKKKPPKSSGPAQVQPPPAPSPGSQDSRDSSSNFSGSNQNSQDAYGAYPPHSAPPPGVPGYPVISSAPSGPPVGSGADTRHSSHSGYQNPQQQQQHPYSLQQPHQFYQHHQQQQHYYHQHAPHHYFSSSTKESIRLSNPFDDSYNARSSLQSRGYPPPGAGYGHYPGSYPNSYTSSSSGSTPRQPWPQSMGPRPHNGFGPPTSSSNSAAAVPYGQPRPGGYPPPPPPPTGSQQHQSQPYSPYPNQYQQQQQSQQKSLGPPHTPAPAPGTPGAPPASPQPKPPPPGTMMPPRTQSPQKLGSGSMFTADHSRGSSRPVILRANTQPTALQSSQTSSSLQNYSHVPPSSSSTSSNSGSGYPPSSKSGVPMPRPPGPPGSYQYAGQRPPMYPGQPWQNRYPGPGFSSSQSSQGPQGNWGPRPWGPFPSSSSGSWGPAGMSKSGMRPGMYPRADPRGMMGPVRASFTGQQRGVRDMAFPPNCVESTNPVMMRRKKYTKMDVQPIDGWKIVMSLKSGLLMEASWALDVLNILLFDDNSFPYFGLGNMPGLFEVLLEHWRTSLLNMFDLPDDLEPEPIGHHVSSGLRSTREKVSASRKRLRAIETSDEENTSSSSSSPSKWWERKVRSVWTIDNISSDSDIEEDLELGVAKKIDPSDKCKVLGGQNFTKRPRFSENDFDVEIEMKEDELFVNDDEKPWDRLDKGYELNSEHWRLGGGNSTAHIIPPLSGDLGLAPFVRMLKDLSPKSSKKQLNKTPDVIKEEKDEAKLNGNCHEDENDFDDEFSKKLAERKGKEEDNEDIVDKIQRLTGIVLRDPDAARARFLRDSLEEECYMRDEPSLHLITETQDQLGKRAVCISTILRNLSFLPGNEFEFGKSTMFLKIAGRLLLLHHWHPLKEASSKNFEKKKEGTEDAGALKNPSSSKTKNNSSVLDETSESSLETVEWCWDYLHVIRENIMVILANIAGALELKQFDEDIIRPIFDGLLEWAVSTSAYAQDPFPFVGPNSPISPQRLAIETLCKLCLHETNVDLLLSTPPYSRIQKLTKLLSKKLYRYEDQVLREFSINLLFYLSGADSGIARVIALNSDKTIGLLLGFIEQAEQNAMVVAQQHGVNALRDNPDSMGTSLDMLRRSASTLLNLSKHPDNIPLFSKHEQRLLSLVMSQILDQGVAAILSSVLFNIGQDNSLHGNPATKTGEQVSNKIVDSKT